MTEPATDRPPLDLDAIQAQTEHLRRCVADVQNHEHPGRGEDLYCLNLVAYMGERMGGVLHRLDRAVAEVTALRAELDAARAMNAALYAVYDTWWNKVGTTDGGIPGHNLISFDDQELMSTACERVEQLLRRTEATDG